MLQYIGIPPQQKIIHPYRKRINKVIIHICKIMVCIFLKSFVFSVLQVYLIGLFSSILFSFISEIRRLQMISKCIKTIYRTGA